MKLFIDNVYDIVFLNFTDANGKNILSYILENKPKQKIVTISNSLDCSEQNGCDYCKKNYNKYRIIKPAKLNDIVLSIKSSICEYEYCNGDLISKLAILSKPYETIIFEKDQMRFYFTSKNKNHILSEIIMFIDILTKNSIDNEVYEDYIQILDY